ncbi:MAG: hypothetical protein BWY59_00189 [Verrucomicrobia bacterium ADurb.Bin345]|nr:MAG: hypothetical protein BWY59_00189 [Verrucomicrobia bacterium ADurb.Bin345]
MATGSAGFPLYVVSTVRPAGIVVMVAPCGEPSYTWLRFVNRIVARGLVTVMLLVMQGAML